MKNLCRIVQELIPSDLYLPSKKSWNRLKDSSKEFLRPFEYRRFLSKCQTDLEDSSVSFNSCFTMMVRNLKIHSKISPIRTKMFTKQTSIYIWKHWEHHYSNVSRMWRVYVVTYWTIDVSSLRDAFSTIPLLRNPPAVLEATEKELGENGHNFCDLLSFTSQ